MSQGGQESEGHGPADGQDVDVTEEGPQHAELVGHLGAPDDGDEGPRRVVEEAAQDLDLAGHAVPSRARQAGRWADHRGVQRWEAANASLT